MKNAVFITSSATYFPNQPVDNDHMEDFLGLVAGEPSRVKRVVLASNGIKNRYYGLNTRQEITHSNSQIAAGAVRGLFKDGTLDDDIDLLTCATSTPDQLLPSHASMVHGELKNKPMEIHSFSGVCLTSLQALKTCYYAIASGEAHKAVCSTSELTSPALLSRNYDPDYERVNSMNEDPYMAFEKDFMRFMLSDGASAVLVQDQPSGDINFRIEWIELKSFANELPTCMFMASEVQENGRLKSWKEYTPQELKDRAVMVGKQDIRVLKRYIVKYWADHIEECLAKHSLTPSTIDYVIPHVSSMFFYHELDKELSRRKVDLPSAKWFTNLTSVGNIGSAAIFAGLNALTATGKLKKGDKILLLVPESGRFSYGTALLTVV